MGEESKDQQLRHRERIGELRDLSEQELIRKHDELADYANSITMMGAKTPFLNHAQTYMNELFRRESIRQAERMEALTRSLNRLTWVITIATIIGVFLAGLTFILGG